MAFDQPTLIKLLSTTAYASLSDADAATLASTPIVTPRKGTITIQTLNGAGVLGFSRTSALRGTLNTVIAAGQATGASTAAVMAAAEASNLLGMLDGPGLLASDPQIASVVSALVTAGLIAQQDATDALNITTYPAGNVVQASDVTAARATMATNAQLVPLRAQVQAGSNAAMALLGNGSAVPTAAALIAAFTAKVTG